jgi:prepilin-type N-terminal cleavage/methylation domain-containing protein
VGGGLLREEGGFTLPELLVTMVMMLTVLFALYSIFDMSIRVFSFGSDKVEAVENARLGLEKVERELRAAYPYDKARGNTVLFPSYGPNPSRTISFGNDLNGNRMVDLPAEQITYVLSVSGPRRTLLRNGQPAAELLAPGGLTFEYLNQFGEPATGEADVSLVRIELRVEANGRAQILATDVALRNRGG